MNTAAMKKTLFLCLFLLSAGMLASLAQTPTTQGKAFWLSYMRNGHHGYNANYNNYRLIVSAKEDCDVVVSNENTNYHDTFHVEAGQVSMSLIPEASAYNGQTEGVSNKGIYVTSTKEISLYIGNESYNSYDASNVLPVPALGTSYMLQTYDSKKASSTYSNDIRASFLIVAVKEGTTTVQITPTAKTDGNNLPGQTYEVTLSQFQSYHVMTKNYSDDNKDGDFSGTRIVSDKPIAVFNGNTLAAVPGGSGATSGYDHIFEQAMPTNYWGKQFVVTSSRCPTGMELGDDEVKITALEDNTIVTCNRHTMFELNSGESTSFTMNLETSSCVYMESNNPIAVYLYNHSHGSTGEQYGDPSMVWISPVEQTLQEVTFSTFNVQEVNYHFVNVVCYTEHVSDMTLDGANISSHFTPVPSNPVFSYARESISHDIHTLRCSGGFIAHVYGIGEQEGYAYSVGSSAKSLTQTLYVNGIPVSDLPSNFSICQNEDVTFRVEANYDDIDHVAWDFGDNTQETGVEVTHVFSTSGQMEVNSVIFRSINGSVQPFDTMSVSFPVKPIPQNTDCYHSSCESWWWWGIECTDTGPYYCQFTTPEGCVYDSIMHFEIEPAEETFDTVKECNSYQWVTGTLTAPGDYEHIVIDYETGCRTIMHLHLILNYTPSLNILGLSNVAVATTYWPGEYLYFLEDTLDLDTQAITWSLSDNEDGSWGFRPHGASCTIITLTMDTKVLYVSAFDGDCHKRDSIVISSSGYAVDEQESIPLEIYPNPAKDELIVKGKEMVDVVLYNLVGQPVKNANTNGSDEVRLNVGTLPRGLYLLEARTRYGNNTRLVSVIR